MTAIEGKRKQDWTPSEVDEASIESFPASDPPAWSPTHAGEPNEDPPQDPEPGEPDMPNPSPS